MENVRKKYTLVSYLPCTDPFNSKTNKKQMQRLHMVVSIEFQKGINSMPVCNADISSCLKDFKK